MLKRFMLAAFAFALMGMDAPVDYSIEAIRYGVSPGVPVSALVVGGPKDEKVDVDFVVWRMIQLAGAVERVVPGHDALQFQKYPTQGRVAKIN
jgi:hypothetical protein